MATLDELVKSFCSDSGFQSIETRFQSIVSHLKKTHNLITPEQWLAMLPKVKSIPEGSRPEYQKFLSHQFVRILEQANQSENTFFSENFDAVYLMLEVGVYYRSFFIRKDLLLFVKNLQEFQVRGVQAFPEKTQGFKAMWKILDPRGILKASKKESVGDEAKKFPEVTFQEIEAVLLRRTAGSPGLVVNETSRKILDSQALRQSRGYLNTLPDFDAVGPSSAVRPVMSPALKSFIRECVSGLEIKEADIRSFLRVVDQKFGTHDVALLELVQTLKEQKALNIARIDSAFIENLTELYYLKDGPDYFKTTVAAMKRQGALPQNLDELKPLLTAGIPFEDINMLLGGAKNFSKFDQFKFYLSAQETTENYALTFLQLNLGIIRDVFIGIEKLSQDKRLEGFKLSHLDFMLTQVRLVPSKPAIDSKATRLQEFLNAEEVTYSRLQQVAALAYLLPQLDIAIFKQRVDDFYSRAQKYVKGRGFFESKESNDALQPLKGRLDELKAQSQMSELGVSKGSLSQQPVPPALSIPPAGASSHVQTAPEIQQEAEFLKPGPEQTKIKP